MYKICTAILHMSNIKLKQRPREEQAEIADPAGLSFAIAIVYAQFHSSYFASLNEFHRKYVS